MSYQAPGPPQNKLDLTSADMTTANNYIQDWALSSTGTGMTPFIMGVEDNTAPTEMNPFDTSFAPKSAQESASLDNVSAANPGKRALSPGAEQSTIKPDPKQQKRPQLQDLTRFDSSVTQASRGSIGGQGAESTDSPASDLGYRAGDSDSDPAATSSKSSSSRARSSNVSASASRPPYQGFGSSFDLSGTEGISSQSFTDMIQGYASQSQYMQSVPKAMDIPQQYAPAQTQPSPLSLPPGVVSTEPQSPKAKGADESAQADVKGNDALPKKQLPARNSRRGKTEAVPPQQVTDNGAAGRANPVRGQTVSTRPQKVEEKLDPEEVKRRQFLERNRVAACKSRQKKKEWVKQLESSAEELNTANSELQKVVHSQQEEIAYLRNMLSSHDGCDCTEVSHIKQKLTGISAPTPRQVGYAPPASSRHGSISAATPASPSTVDTPASIPTSYPSPGSLVPGTAQAGAAQAQAQQARAQQQLLDPIQQFTVEEGTYSGMDGSSAPQSYDYFSGPSYNTLPFTTPDLVSELGYGSMQ